MVTVSIYDSTLRDGAQMAGINFSLRDKFFIIQNYVDELAIPHIEVYPSSNVKDQKLIAYVREKEPRYLDHLVSFGSTRHVSKTVEEDENLQKIIESGLKTACIFGKSWDFHLSFIHASEEQNLQMIEESVAFLKSKGLKVFFDGEHFFDGYKSSAEYALKTLAAAEKGGADALILCDTNGGVLPHEVYDITEEVLKHTSIPLGIHAHNDSGMGVANSIAAVQACKNQNRDCQVQGTINGLGERTGNANLTTIIPVLALKMNFTGVISTQYLGNLTSVSNFLCEISNMTPPVNASFVGHNAFTHRGGMHIAAIEKDLKSYEHVDPNKVGNKRRVLISEMSGRSAILHKCKKFGIQLEKESPVLKRVLEIIKRKESQGYTYEGADASLEILIRGVMEDPEVAASFYRRYYFEVEYFRVITDARNIFEDEKLEIFTDANIKTIVAHPSGFHEYHTASEGNGPVSALDNAFQKSLFHFYPVLKEIELIDFKVRIANASDEEIGTASRVRVFIITRDKDGQLWGTIGSHVNIIVASFLALLDSYIYKLMKEHMPPYTKTKK